MLQNQGAWPKSCKILIPQQPTLMGSSAQKSSGVHWCRRRVRFNRVPGEGGFGAEPGQVQQGSGEGSEEGVGGFCAKPSKFNRVLEKVPEKVGEALVQSQVKFKRFREGLGGFGAEPGQVNRNPQKGSGEGLGGFEDQQGSEKVPEKVRRGSGEGSGEGSGGFGAKPGQVQNRVQKRVPGGCGEGLGEGSGEGCGAFGAEPGQVQQGSGEGSGERLGGFGAEPVRFNRICGHLTHGTQLRCFQRLLRSTSERFENKTLRLLGIPPKLIKSPPTTTSMGLFWYQI